MNLKLFLCVACSLTTCGAESQPVTRAEIRGTGRPITLEELIIPPTSLKEFSSVMGPPTTVSMHLNNATLREAVAELSRQSNVPIQAIQNDYWPVGGPRVTVNIDNSDFWTAVRSITPPGIHFVWSADWAKHVLTIFPGAVSSKADLPSLLPIQRLGLFTVAAHSYGSRSDKRLSWYFEGKPIIDDQSQSWLNLQIFIDPKLVADKAGFWPSSVFSRIEEAVDDTGQSLITNNGDSRLDNDDSFPILKIMGLLKVPSANATFIRQVRGRFSFDSIKEKEEWHIHLNNGSGKAVRVFQIKYGNDQNATAQPVSLSVEVASEGDVAGASVNITAKGQLPYSLTHITADMIQLKDVKGNTIGQFVGGGGNDVVWSGSYNLPLTANRLHAIKPVTLLISLPTEFRRVEVPFELKDIPLPPSL